MTDIPQPPCPVDLEPYDFLSFPKLKIVLGRRIFNDNRYVSKQSSNILSFKLCTAQNTLNNGTIIGLAVYSPKETTLK